jgi:hypothetical protein
MDDATAVAIVSRRDARASLARARGARFDVTIEAGNDFGSGAARGASRGAEYRDVASTRRDRATTRRERLNNNTTRAMRRRRAAIERIDASRRDAF